MSGLHNQVNVTGTPYVPRLINAAPPATAAPGAPAMAADQVVLGQGAPVAQIAGLRQQLRAGSPVEAAMAIYQLEALAATNRDMVVPILLDQLSAGGTTTRAAIDILGRLKAPEAAPYLQNMMTAAGDAGIRSAAASAYSALTGPAPAPAAPTPAPGPVGPSTPLVTPSTPAAPTADGNALLARLLDPAQAPAAAVELAKLPTAQLLPITQRLLNDFRPEPRTLELVVTLLARRLNDPGAVQQLQGILRKDRADAPGAIGKAAMALLSTRNPAHLTDVLRAVATRNAALNPVKRAIIDTVAKNPPYLTHPAAGPVFAAVLKANEAPELAASASYALSQIKSAQARDALAASPLLGSTTPALRLRALTDLGAHPAPYPPAAQAQLQRLAGDPDPQVQAKAKELLGKQG